MLSSLLRSFEEVLCEVNSFIALLSRGTSSLFFMCLSALFVGIVNLLFSSIYQFATRIEDRGMEGSYIAALVTGPPGTFALGASRSGRSRLSCSTGRVALRGVSFDAY